MRKIITILKIVVISAVVMGLGLTLNKMYQANQVATIKESRKTPHLNIALVNEDAGAKFNGQPVNMGQSYAYQVEQDKKNDWYLVSSGIGANGLRNGDYQLVITIPNNFSSKLIDLNATKPTSTDVTYAVASSSDTNVRATAERIGVKTINELNKQLVNMYFASVLDNLYTAQNNVSKLVKNDAGNVDKYNTVLTGPSQNMQGVFPSLSAGGESAKQTNQTLQHVLGQIKNNAETVYGNAKDGEQSLADMLSAHATNDLSSKNLYDSLVAMNPDVLSDQITAAMTALIGTRDTLNNSLVSKSTDTIVGDATTPVTLEKSLEDLNSGLEQSKTNTVVNYSQTLSLIKQISDLQQTYADKLASQLGLTSNDDITMGQLLSYKEAGTTTPGHETVDNIATVIEQRNENQVKKLQSEIDALPFANVVDDALLTDYIEQATTDDDQKIDTVTLGHLQDLQTKITTIKTAVDDYNNSTTDKKMTLVFQSKQAADCGSDAKKLRSDLQTILSAYQKEQADNLAGKTNFDQQNHKLITDTQADVQRLVKKYNGLSDQYNALRDAANINNGSPVDLGKYPQADKENDAPAQGTEPSLTGPNATKFGQENYGRYEYALGSVSQMYDVALKDVMAFKSDEVNNQDIPNQVVGILNVSVKSYLTNLGAQILMSNLGLDNATLPNGTTTASPNDLLQQINDNKDSANLATLFAGLMNQYNVVTTNAGKLSNQVSVQAQQLQKLQADFTSTNQAHSKAKDAEGKMDDAIQKQVKSFQTLLIGSQSLKQDSTNQTDDAKTTTAAMDEFAKQVAEATSNGKKLNGAVKDLAKGLSDTLGNNKDFSLTFSNVLNNAHQNGVKNESLLTFLANPVNSSLAVSNQNKSASLNPFGWLFVLYVASFILVYFVQGSKLTKRVPLSVVTGSHWIRDNLVAIGINLIGSLILAFAFGYATYKDLILSKSGIPMYFVAIVVVAIFFGMVNRFLLAEFKLIGMGIIQIFSVSYVFTSLVGTGIGAAPSIVLLIGMINPLSVANRVVVAAVNNYNLPSELTGVLIMTLVAFVLNLVVYKRKGNWNWQNFRQRLTFRKRDVYEEN